MGEAFVVESGILSVPESRIQTHEDRRHVLAACREALSPGDLVRVPWRFDRHGATRSEVIAYCMRLQEQWSGSSPSANEPRRRPYAVEIVREAMSLGFRVSAWYEDGVELQRLDDQLVANAAHMSRRPREISFDAWRAWSALAHAENWRRFFGPRIAIEKARARGRTRAAGDAVRRAWIADLVFALDLFFPGGPNCYRRVLAETSLDAGAAGDEIALGLDPAATGHAWLVPRTIEVPRELGIDSPITNRI